MARSSRTYRPRRYHATRSVDSGVQIILVLVAAAGIVSLSFFTTSLLALGIFVISFFPYIVLWIVLIGLAAFVLSLLVRSMRVGTDRSIRPSTRSLNFTYAHPVVVEHPSIEVGKPAYESLPYTRTVLMNTNERDFFWALQKIVPDTYYIVPQVMWTRLIAVDKHETFHNRAARFKYHNLINRNSVDFVLFTKPNMEPALIIEVDGPSHHAPKVMRRDHLLDSLAAKVGIPIVHIHRTATYEPLFIQNQIAQVGFQLSPRMNSYR